MIGAHHWRPGWGERLALGTILVGLALVLVQQDSLWRWDRVFYDAQLQLWNRPPADDIVIVAVDEASLREFGRWPWSRGVHADLLRILDEERPKAIGFDVIFAEADLQNPGADRAFARAIGESGRVVLPVLMEQMRIGGQPVETLPLPALADAAAALGHVHVELDPDGIARELFLYEGLGAPHWPHISVALLQTAGENAGPAPQPEDAAADPGSAFVWYRSTPLLVPFAGPPGHFRHISYGQVMKKAFRPGTFRDKYVLIGTTASGLGDALPTPLSGFSHSMSGVEINANILDALRRGLAVTPLSPNWQMTLSGLFALLPLLLFPRRAPRTNLVITALLLVLCLSASALLLVLAHRWFPPTAALLAVALSYPLWSWRRLELAMRYLGQELDRLHVEQSRLHTAGNSLADDGTAIRPDNDLQARIAQVQQATVQLRRLRRFIDGSMANMADGVVVTDPSGQVILANARAAWYLRADDHARLDGLPVKALLDDLALEQGGDWTEALHKAVHHGDRLQFSTRHRQGRDLLVQVAPLNRDTGDSAGLIFNFSDISRLKASERKRNELLNFLSHDLRAPLVSMSALIDLARRQPRPDEIDKLLTRMESYTGNTLNLAEQFLQLARAESSESFHFREVDLVSIALNALEQVWAQAQRRHIALEQDLAIEEAWMLGDGALLERALVNLLDNAIKYSDDGTTVHLAVHLEGGDIQCCVADRGRGIAAAELPHLFERFRRIEESGAAKTSGAGLGLAFVDAVVRRHAGHIDVQSRPGEGSTFCLRLPAEQD